MQAPKTLLIAFLVLGGLIAITPTANSQGTCVWDEDFEDDQLFFRPEACFYTLETTGTTASNIYTSSAQAIEGQSLLQQVGHAASPQVFSFLFADTVPCEPDSEVNFAFNTPSLPLSSIATTIIFESAAATSSLALQIEVAGTVKATLTSTGGSFQTQAIPDLVISPSTWYNVTFTGFVCTGTESAVVLFPDQGTGVCVCPTSALAGTVEPFIRFRATPSAFGSTQMPTGSFYLDNLNAPGITTSAIGPGSIFCANPAETDYGYEYVEGTTFESSFTQADIGLDDGFLFTGDSSNSEYLAKGFDTGTEAISVKMKIEAAVDGSSSLFRAAFTTGATAPPSAANKGDGKDGGNFDDHVGVRFEESGGNWIIGIYQNVGGAGYTRIGSAVNYGDPNNPTNFNFTVDSRTLVANLTSEGNLLLTRAIDASFQDITWKDQWFVGTGATFALNANTILDDADQSDNDDSTCIFDLIGGATATGSQGLSPGSSTPDAPTASPTLGPGSIGSVFVNITDAGTQIFMGFLLVFGVVWMGIRQNAGFAAIGALFIIGLILSYGAGLTPLWVLILVFVLSLATVWFLPKPNAGGI